MSGKNKKPNRPKYSKDHVNTARSFNAPPKEKRLTKFDNSEKR